MKVKCLSVRQPWAQAIFELGKDVENRTWATQYRGPLLIHASKRIDREAMANWGRPGPLATGAILGVVELTDIVEHSRSMWAAPDSYHWLLRNACLIEKPIPYVGSLRLFEVEIPDRIGLACVKMQSRGTSAA